MTTNQYAYDLLTSSVPKLDPSGENWAIFSYRFEDAVRAKRVWGHFDGSSVRPGPAPPPTAPPGMPLGPQQWPSLGTSSALGTTTQPPGTSSSTPSAPRGTRVTRSQVQTPAPTTATTSTAVPTAPTTTTQGATQVPLPPSRPPSPTPDERKAQKDWDNEEALSQYLLSQRIPDSTLMRVRRFTTVAERWTAIVIEYTDKSMYAQTSLKAEFLESKCPKGSNVKTFLQELRSKRETDRKSTRLNSSHSGESRMPSSA